MHMKGQRYQGDNIMENRIFAYCNVDAKSSKDLFKLFFNDLKENNYVEDSWLEAITKREQNYPTGLRLPGICVAIPHAEAVNVKKSTLAVATLKNPVVFMAMDEPEEAVNVNIVISLIVSDPKQQIPLLQSVVDAIQDESFLKQLLDASKEEDIVCLVNERLSLKENL